MESSASAVSASNMVVVASTAFGLTAALLAISLPLLQTDLISRTWLLSSRALQSKRNAQYQYRWKIALDKTLYFLYYVYFAELQERRLVEWHATEEELNVVVQQIVDPKQKESQPPPRPLWIGLDVDHDDPRGEYYLYLLQRRSSESGPERGLVKVPLVAFGLKLYEAFQAQVTTTTLCFVADASSGLGTRWITGLLESSNTGVVLFREPLWIVTLAFLAQQRLVSTEKLQKVVFGLCRLEAWRVRDQLGDAKTVVFTLPGQGAVPVLLPLVQAAFPEDRHVFCYDGCVASVERAVSLELSPPPQPASTQQLLPRLDDVLQWNYHPLVSIGTPIHPTKLPNALPNFVEASRKLPVRLASAVHAWMDSVDTFVQLKSSSSNNSKSSQLEQYLPYVCKLSFLQSPSFDNIDNNHASPNQDSLYSLSSLLQYITGYHHRSRPLPPHVLDAAVDYWRKSINNYNQSSGARETLVRLSVAQKRAIEDCVFRHKSILIGDKTLPDTVLPAQHWTLKQASKKSSCACCAPENDEDDEEGGIIATANTAPGVSPFLVSKTRSGDGENGSTSGGTGIRQRPKFVDGKSAFAFDPTAFSMR